MALTMDEMKGINSKIKEEDMLEVKANLETAKEDTTPHVGVTDSDILVIGDANKTEVKKHDYKARFRYPASMAEHIDESDIIQRVGDYIIVEIEFKDVQILPRNDLKVVANVAEMLPFFRKLDNAGGVESMSESEAITMAREVGDEVLDSMYWVVGAFLDIDKETVSNMLYSSVMSLLAKFMEDFPEVFNESDFSSGQPTEQA